MTTSCTGRWITFATVLLFVKIQHSITVESNKKRTWPTHYTKVHRDLHQTVEKKTHPHLEDFQIVIPVRTDKNYQYTSHVVRYRRRNRVRRRSLDEPNPHYALTSFGQKFHIRLEPNYGLLNPSFSISNMKNGTEKKADDDHVTNCHYKGWLASPDEGSVSISTCVGLTGVLRTSKEDILIEPVLSSLNHSFQHPLHPHITYKRRHFTKRKQELHFCGKKLKHLASSAFFDVDHVIRDLSNREFEPDHASHRKSARSRRSLVSVETRLHDKEPTVTAMRRPKLKTVETLVVADRALIRNHERDKSDVTTYVLTVMNMVSGLFQDHTLDDRVNIAVSGLILLQDDDSLHLNHKADRSLATFCDWQFKLNHSNRGIPDHSVLLTGIDICIHSNGPCETLGLAEIGGMCSRRHSCTINEDLGLGLAFTVAHEMGHSFGMKHDGQGNLCSRQEGHIMSPTLDGRNGVITWSQCSREKLNGFLLSPASLCLDTLSSTVENLTFPQNLPGETYSATTQCQWQFGYSATLCDFRYDFNKAHICTILWCQKEGKETCRTKHLPAAEGTNCGENKYCRRGSCVFLGSDGPEPIDGSWAVYRPWSSCTRSCGAGVQFRKRTCSNPFPKFGGRHCSGESKAYQLCNVERCPSKSVDFRTSQCAAFNSRPYRRRLFTWVPFTKYMGFGRNSCSLLCQAEGFGFFDMLADKVIDGTKCNDDSLDVCIDGTCRHVGCDYILDSNATYDICGICKGDNSTCDVIKGEFNGPIENSGYYKVVEIPRGARNVKIQEQSCCTHSYLAIRSASSPSKYYLNGNWRIDLKAPKTIAGVRWNYYRHGFLAEKMISIEPLLEDIVVEVLVIIETPGISYSYSFPKQNRSLSAYPPLIPIHIPSYSWNVSYGRCSQSCGGGFMSANVTCLRNGLAPVNESYCDVITKPTVSVQECQTKPCPARWETSLWGECSSTCGRGMQSRKVFCKVSTPRKDVLTLESNCIMLKKPRIYRRCKVASCPAEWKVDNWSKCSRSCGRGIRRRRVYCSRGGKRVRPTSCERDAKPRRKERCILKRCRRNYQWHVTGWNQCSSKCTKGFQRRKIKCGFEQSKGHFKYVGSRRCGHLNMPDLPLKRKCVNLSCGRKSKLKINNTKSLNPVHRHHLARAFSGVWISGAWEKCSATCGGGTQKRVVRCMKASVLSRRCDLNKQPSSERPCNTYQCSLLPNNERALQCADNFSWCDLVPQHGQCSHQYFGKKCCKACSVVS